MIVADDNRFYVIQWESSNIIAIVSQSSIFKSPEFTYVNDICFVEIDGQYEKAKILFIGKLHSIYIVFQYRCNYTLRFIRGW